MVGYLSLAFAVLTAIVGYAAGYGGSKAILKRLESDFSGIKESIVYKKNCELYMDAIKARVLTLEREKTTTDTEVSAIKTQMARLEEMLKAQGTVQLETKEMVKELYNGKHN